MVSPVYAMPSVRRHHLSRSEIFLEWVKERSGRLALFVFVLVLAGGVGWAVFLNRQKLADRGSEQLSQVQSLIVRGDRKEAHRLLDEILQRERTGPTALQAYLAKGDLFFGEKKFSEATRVYEAGGLQAVRSDYKVLLLAGQASSLVEEKKWAEALAVHEKIMKEFPTHYLTPRVLMESGRLQVVLGKKTEARETFDRVLTLYPKSPWAPSATETLAQLTAAVTSEMIPPDKE